MPVGGSAASPTRRPPPKPPSTHRSTRRPLVAVGALALAAARVTEGERPGPFTHAAELLARATRAPWRRHAPATPRSRALRAAARDLARLSRLTRDDGPDWLRLAAAIAELAATIAAIREANGELEQARAAAAAAALLAEHATVAPPAARPGPPPTLSTRPARPAPLPPSQHRSR